MTDRILEVHVELGGETRMVGTLYARANRAREGATFRYDPSWLELPERFALEPALSLDPVSHHTRDGRSLFGAIGDSAPDRWGRSLIARAERLQAKAEKRQPRSLFEIDYLLGVNDETRPGALRFRDPGDGPFQSDGTAHPVPPLVSLRALLDASARFESEADNLDDIRLLLAPGSSLGGARPKASVRLPDGTLAIAKFPSATDTLDVVRWEAITLELAQRAGVIVPPHQFHDVDGRSTLVLPRFDRAAGARIPYLSAMSMLDAWDGDRRSYLEIADALRRHGALADEDLRQLWRRIVFTVLVSNTDDHLRNHGFLYTGTEGWRLSPAFDLNPVPTDVRPRMLATTIGESDDASASLSLALDLREHFALKAGHAKVIAREVGRAISEWRVVARRLGATAAQVDRMATAFEHEDMEEARRL